ncbi:cellulase family glycosylhydrolase [Demequina pelophila]|uniref:cellulase family glycosylhydrolase n=1 Tax=Demequina pelophila TaxID=1638984 RepID=UPI001D0F1862|nr:cellulase family glycosylhydrolase [Demequina pelophila]
MWIVAGCVGLVGLGVGGTLMVTSLAGGAAAEPGAGPSEASSLASPGAASPGAASPGAPAGATPSPATSSAAADAPAVCTVSAAIENTWEGGFQAALTIEAHAALEDWSASLDLGDATVDAAWNATLASGATGRATAGAVDYNRALAAGDAVDFGFTASGDAPDALAQGCDGAATGADGEAEAGAGGASSPVSSTDSSTPAADVPPATPGDGDDWLRTDGNRIVDLDGNQVWLTGANWFGFNTSERVLHGLSNADMDAILDQVAQRGLNVLRVPISTELLLEWRAGEAQVPSAINQAGPQAGLTTLEVFDAFLAGCRERGVKVILDVHSAEADNMGHMAPMWFSGSVSAADFVTGWEWIAQRYREDDTILGFDLQNEPHGQADESPRAKWDGSRDADNWAHVAESLALRLLEIHPDALVLVEGIEIYPRDGRSWGSTDREAYFSTWWGGNLRGVARHPLDLGEYQDRLVYSPHEYGPLVYEQEWFRGAFSRESLEHDVWGPNWLYIHDQEVAPLLIGEWGGRLGQDERQDRWMEAVRDLIVDRRLHHTFWCVNPNSGDTGGLLLDDWASWDEEKYALLRPALWQDSQGRFVSLDHQVPLPGGVTVTEFYEAGGSL